VIGRADIGTLLTLEATKQAAGCTESACMTEIAGALEEQDYLGKLRRAGFEDAGVDVTNVYDSAPENSCCGAPALPAGVRLVSGFVRATKPRD